MKPKTNLKLIIISLFLFSLSYTISGQTSVALKSKWLDPNNLFTEDKLTAEFSTIVPVGGFWSLYFYYVHDIEGLIPI